MPLGTFVLTLVGVYVAFGPIGSAHVLQAPAASTQSESGREPQQPQPQITVEQGRLTIQAQDALVQRLLEEIARQSGVAIEGAANAGDHRVSVTFDGLPLEQGLRLLLGQYDAFFFYGVEKPAGSALRKVWMYAKGQGAILAPVPMEQWASTQELERALTDSDPDVRADAIDQLVDRKGERALSAVVQALSDPDDAVRLRALDAATTHAFPIPPAAVQDLVLSHPSADVRKSALEIVAESPDVKPLAEAALSDPSAAIRAQAKAILSELSEASNRAEPAKEVRPPL